MMQWSECLTESVRGGIFRSARLSTARAAVLLAAITLAGRVLNAGERLPSELAGQYRELAIRQYSQIANLYVAYSLTISRGDKSSVKRREWALSGVKRFRKRYWHPEDKGGRWGCAVYDGEFLRSYDSGTGGGTLRSASQYDPRGVGQPSTWSDYSRCVGHLTHGAIWELMAAIPLPKWDVTWAEDGHSLVFATREVEPPATDEWTLDPLRGFVITRWRNLDRAEDGGSVTVVEMKTLHVREVMPGIWLPTEVETRMKGTAGELLNRVLVDEMRVNSPETERLFSFSWPQGAIYYDYRVEASVDPNATEDAIAASIDGMVEDCKVLSRPSPTAGTPGSAPIVTPAGPGSADTEDAGPARAPVPAAGMPTDTAAAGRRAAPPMSLGTGVLVAAGVAAVLWVLMRTWWQKRCANRSG